MSVTSTQRNATRNQSTLDVQLDNIFICKNRFSTGTFKNTTAGAFDLKTGIFVARHATLADTLIPVTSANVADIIGIAKVDGTVTLAAAGESFINYAISGDIDAGLIQFPATVTLDTMVGAKALKDVLNDLGFVLNKVTENSKFDN
jgi:hypothetical protein